MGKLIPPDAFLRRVGTELCLRLRMHTAVRNSKSPNPGLGTLGRLPLEIRDMIFELATSPPEDYPRYELPLQSIQHAKSRISEVISPRIRTQGSRQLYRELLEAFLRTTPIEVHPYNVERLEQILSGLDLVADITKHTRIIRVVHPSSLVSLDNRYQVARSFPRIFDSLRGCPKQYGILASRFCYFVRYERFYYRVFRPFEQTLGALLNENFNHYFGTVNRGQYVDIDIAMGDREKSIRNMHQACERNERKIRELFKDLANDPRIPETVRKDHRLRAVYEEAISQAVGELAIIKARHLPLIEQAILCWQVEDDKEPETKDQQPLSFGDKTQTTGKPYKKLCRHQQLSARSRYVALHPLKSSQSRPYDTASNLTSEGFATTVLTVGQLEIKERRHNPRQCILPRSQNFMPSYIEQAVALWCKENNKRERSDWPSKGSITDESTNAKPLNNDSVAMHFAIPAPRAERFSSFQTRSRHPNPPTPDFHLNIWKHSPVFSMDNPKLGTLGRLPRETRNMILNLVVNLVQSHLCVIRVLSARQEKRRLQPPKH